MSIEVDSVHYQSNNQNWQTPQWLLDKLRSEFGQIGLDPATTVDNPTAAVNFYTPTEDGLICDWGNKGWVFVNPPYGRDVKKWIQRANFERKCNLANEHCIMLLAARPDTKSWQECILPNAEICWISGRIKFIGGNNPTAPAPFPSALVYYGPSRTKFYRATHELGVITCPM